MKKILLVGGGTGGHIMPLIPLIHELHKHKAEVVLVAANQKIDKHIVDQNIPSKVKTYFVRTGKFRRYFSWKNFTDIFHVLFAINKARIILKEENPDSMFVKGGYVGVPFVVANWLFRLKVPVYTHESDSSPGLATRIAKKFATQHFGNFGEPNFPLFYLPTGKLKDPYNKKNKLPKLLLFGGSLGGIFINKMCEYYQQEFLAHYDVTLITGKGKKVKIEHPNFKQFEIIPADDMAAYISFADIIISRGGANSIFEIVNAKRPSIIIPLPSDASRNDQYYNAHYFAKKNLCEVFEQHEITDRSIVKAIAETLENTEMKQALQKTDIRIKAKEIAEILTAK